MLNDNVAIKTKNDIAGDAMVVDKTARIHPSAQIADHVKIGPWSVIGPNVQIGSGTKIGSHVVIDSNTKIGNNNNIYPYASIGGDPQDLSYQAEETWLHIGDDNVIREFATINRGSSGGSGVTRIGNKNCFLAYTHVAHDCQISNEILFVNNASIAGHVIVDDYAILGAFTAVHQFCRVGAYSFLSRATEISKDIPPYMLVRGIPGWPCGLNVVGLKRRGFGDETLRVLKKAYQIMYRRGLKLQEVRNQLAELAKQTPEIELILELMDSSERGIARQCREEGEELRDL